MDNNINYDKELFIQINNIIDDLIDSNNVKTNKLNKLSKINNELNGVKKSIIDDSTKSQTDNKNLNNLLNESLKINQQVLNDNFINNLSNNDLTDKYLKLYDDLSLNKKQFYELINKKQYLIQVLNNINVLKNIINSYITYDDTKFNLQSDIQLSPAYLIIKDSNLFDIDYYKKTYNISQEDDAIEHYLLIGANKYYNPSRNFNTLWYKNTYLLNNDANPLVNYILEGQYEGKLTLPPHEQLGYNIKNSQEYILIEESNLFDKKFYKNTYNITTDPIEHYINVGCVKNYKPFADFDVEWYKNNYNVTNENVLVDYILNYPNNNYQEENLYNKPILPNINESYPYIFIEEYGLLDYERYNKYQNKGFFDDEIENYIEIGYDRNYFLNLDFNKNDYVSENDLFEDSLWNYVYDVAYKEYKFDRHDYSNVPKLNVTDSVEYNLIKESGLFDEVYYKNKYNIQEDDLLSHYILIGADKNYNPSEYFDTKQYKQNNLVNINPLYHYILNGKNEIFVDYDLIDDITQSQEYIIIYESGLFDYKWYVDNYSKKYDIGENPIVHYLTVGIKNNLNPNSKFDTEKFCNNNPYLDMNPFAYYILNNPDETFIQEKAVDDEYIKNYAILNNSKYFDSVYYSENNPNITDNDDPIEYYLKKGYSEDYPTSKYFDKKEYYRLNLDLKTYKIDPVIHYTLSGYKERRPFKRSRLKLDDLTIYDKSIIEQYNTIYDSDYFDEYYYIENNPEVEILDIDPILHYLLIGYKNNKNPSKYFSSEEYLNVYGDVKRHNINPLYHYLKNGINEGRHCFIPKEKYVNNYHSKFDLLKSKDILNKLQDRISIIIPIYNAYEETKQCITSVLQNTHINYELILINDCSTDKRINKLLDDVSNIPFVKVINNKTNQGFVKNVNMGMKLSKYDVVLLNSDTIVTPKWLSKIVVSAYSNDKIGTVTPISNSSDLSIPELGRSNDQSILNTIAYNVDKLSYNGYLESPTGNGFCLFIKRKLIDEIGYFDEIFGKGYGEETDFTTRARNNGWINIRDFSVFIYHRRHASFKKENTNKLKVNNQKILRKRYPDIFNSWDNFYQSVEVQSALNNIRDNIKFNENNSRILCITEDTDGVVDIDNLMLLRLSRKYDTYVLAIGENSLKLFKYTPDISSLFKQWEYDYSWDIDKFFKLYFNILINLKIDLIYIKNNRRLYHETNQDIISYNKIISSLEINQLVESTHTIDTIIPAVDKLLNPIESLNDLIKRYSSNISFDEKKVVVYTAVTGTYDEPIVPSYINDNVDYVCFTDNPYLKSDFWDIRLIEDSDFDPIRTARMYKILPHKYLSEYDYSLWIDTNIEIIGDIQSYINKYSVNNKLLAFNHFQRNCIYEEADECIKSKKDDDDVIIPQMQRYKQEGYPSNNGLIFSAILFRNHHDEAVIKLMEDWFDEVKNESFRDQLSFNYVCWKNNFNYDLTTNYILKNEYFQMHEHLSKGYFIRTINTPYDSWYHLKYSIDDVNKIIESFNKKTSIVIPIYNAYDETKECIESVLRNTSIDYELILINDCSSDKRIYDLLDAYKDYENITVVHNQTNNGFVKNVNKSFMLTSNDVVLLNSDTIVTPKWLQRLKFKAYTQNDIATVTPVSNNAGAFSIPKAEANDIPDRFSIDDMANIVEKNSDDSVVFSPTANGFCMYIKRDAINDVGFFDEIYGMGYGEENDFCMRLVRRGWKHVIEPSVYIYHKRSASFSDKKAELIRKHSKILRIKFPDYKSRVNEFLSSTDFKKIRLRLNEAINSTKVENNRKRILYAIHNGSGGALHTTMDIMKNIDESLDVYLLVTGKTDISLYKYNRLGNNNANHKDGDKEFIKYLQLIRKWPKEYVYSALDSSIDELKMIYFNILINLKIDIVHVMHLIHSSFDLVNLSKLLGLPVIMSFHDFYYICPSHNLLDDNERYCGGVCTPYNQHSINNGQCSMAAGLNLPLLKTYKNTWQTRVSEMFENCDVFQAPSQCVYDMYTKFYPKLTQKDFRVIEHGRDLKTPDNININKISKNSPIKILFPGHIGKSKGYELIKEIKKQDIDNRLEFHYMGSIYGSEDLEEYGTYHGFYDRSDFDEIVKEVNPHFIGILSIWPETYCHTLTESWASGIPVLTIDIGALGERVHKHGGGFFIDMDAKRAYNQILDISLDYDNYLKVCNEVKNIDIKTSKQMSNEYLDIYNKYLQ